MNLYEMPDGNQYEFVSDTQATEAMDAWHKQFGTSNAWGEGSALQNVPTEEVIRQAAEQAKTSPFTAAIAGSIGAPIETITSMLTGAPFAIAGGAAQLGSLIQGGSPQEQAQAVGQYTPDILKAIAYQPRLPQSQMMTRGLSAGFKEVGKGLAIPGAAIEATRATLANRLSSDTNTMWGEEFLKSYGDISKITESLFDIGMAAQIAKGGMEAGKGVSNYLNARSAANKAKIVNEGAQTALQQLAEQEKQQKQQKLEATKNPYGLQPETKDTVKTKIATGNVTPEQSAYLHGIELTKVPIDPYMFQKFGEVKAQLGETLAQLTVRVEEAVKNDPYHLQNEGKADPITGDILPNLGIETKPIPDPYSLKNGEPTKVNPSEELTPTIPKDPMGLHPETPATISTKSVLEIAKELEAHRLQSDATKAKIPEQVKVANIPESLPIKDALGNVVDSLADYLGAKKNFIPGEGLHKALTDLSRSLWDAGHQTFLKASAEARKMLGEDWKDVAPLFKQAWDYTKSIQPGLSINGNVKDVFTTKPNNNYSIAEVKDRFLREHGVELSDTNVDAAKAIYDTVGNMDLKQKAISNIPGLSVKDSSINRYESRNPDDISGSINRININSTADLPSKPGGFFRNTTSRGRMQANVLKNPIVDEAIGFVTSVIDKYKVQAANQISDIKSTLNVFDLSTLYNAIGGKVEPWRKAAEVFATRRANEFNATFDPKAVFSNKQLELFNKIDKTLNDIYSQVNTRLRELDPKGTDLKQLPYYFMSLFKGDWQIPVMKGDKFLFMLREDNKAGALSAKEWATSKGFETGDVSIRKTSSRIDRKEEQQSDFEHLLQVLGEKDPDVSAAVERMTQAMNQKAIRSNAMPERFMEKSGRVGSMGDRPWRTEIENYRDNVKALDSYIQGANDWLQKTQIGKYHSEFNKTEGLKTSAPNASSFINDYIASVMDKKQPLVAFSKSLGEAIAESMSNNPIIFGDKWANNTSLQRGARQLANLTTSAFIGIFSPVHFIQNVLQPLKANWPKMIDLAVKDGITGFDPNNPFIRNPLVSSLFGYVEGVRDLAQTWTGRLGKSEDALYKEQNHITDAHLAIQGETFDNPYASLITDVGLHKSVSVSENIARSVSFSMYKRFLTDSGFSEARARDMAKNLTAEYMVNYGKEAKAQVIGRAGMLGEAMGRLQTFKVNDLTQVYEYFSDIKLKDPKSIAPMATFLLTTLVTAGALGMVGMDVVEQMWRVVQLADRSLGKPHVGIQMNSPKSLIYEKLPVYISKGAASYYVGADVSGSFATQITGDYPIEHPVADIAIGTASAITPIVSGIGKEVLGLGKTLKELIFGGDDLAVGRALSEWQPASTKKLVVDKYLTTKTASGLTETISPTKEGKVNYIGKDSPYIIGGLKTLEAGMQSTAANIDRQRDRYQTDMKQKLENKIKDIAFENYKANRATSNDFTKPLGMTNSPEIKKKLQETVDSYIEVGGDPTKLISKLEDQYMTYNVGSNEIASLVKNINLGNYQQNTRHLDTIRARQERAIQK